MLVIELETMSFVAIIVLTVAATDLLEELRRCTQQHSSKVLRLTTSEQCRERSVAANVTRSANAIGNDVCFRLDFLVFPMLAAKSSQRSHCLIMTIARHEPTRRLRKKHHESREEEAEDALESDRKSPREILWPVAGAKINPVCYESSNRNHTAFDTDEKTAVGGLGAFCLVGRDGGSVHSVAYAGDGSADDELSHGAHSGNRGDLDNNSDNHNNTAHDDSASSTQDVAKPKLEDRAEETADLVYGGDETLPRRIVSRLRKCTVELRS